MDVLDDKYRIEDTKLGSGSFSEVFLGTDLDGGKKVAVKKISMSQRKNILNKIVLEIQIMKQLDHPNIVKFYDLVKTEQYWYIIMEYCNAGTIGDVIKYNEDMSGGKTIAFNREANSYYYLDQLKDALNYIRSHGFSHRDIKPMNILLCDPNEPDSTAGHFHYSRKLVVKLADFGLAKEHEETDKSLKNTICGSPLYMAPEVLIDFKYDSRADLWSFGVIMYELLFGRTPAVGNSLASLRNNLQNREIDFHPNKNFSPQCFDLLRKLLAKNSNSRIGWDYFFNHEWFGLWENLPDKDGGLVVYGHVIAPEEPRKEQTPEPRKYHTRSSIFLSGSPSFVLGSSNLTRMSIGNYKYIKAKKGTYSDYPAPCPANCTEKPRSTTEKINNGATKPIEIPAKTQWDSFSINSSAGILNWDYCGNNSRRSKILNNSMSGSNVSCCCDLARLSVADAEYYVPDFQTEGENPLLASSDGARNKSDPIPIKKDG